MVTMSKKFRQDWGGWLIALWHPQPRVRLRGRVRYLDESSDLLGNDEADANLERSVSFQIDAGIGIREKDTIRVRADAKSYLDERTSTKDREPNPDFQLWLQYEARL